MRAASQPQAQLVGRPARSAARGTPAGRVLTGYVLCLPAFLVDPTRSLENSNAVQNRLAQLRPASPFAVRQQQLTATHTSSLPKLGAAPEFTDNQRWFNTPQGRPLTLAGLRGHVVLVDCSGDDRRRRWRAGLRRGCFGSESVREGKGTAAGQNGDQQDGANNGLSSHWRSLPLRCGFSRPPESRTWSGLLRGFGG